MMTNAFPSRGIPIEELDEYIGALPARNISLGKCGTVEFGYVRYGGIEIVLRKNLGFDGWQYVEMPHHKFFVELPLPDKGSIESFVGCPGGRCESWLAWPGRRSFSYPKSNITKMYLVIDRHYLSSFFSQLDLGRLLDRRVHLARVSSDIKLLTSSSARVMEVLDKKEDHAKKEQALKSVVATLFRYVAKSEPVGLCDVVRHRYLSRALEYLVLNFSKRITVSDLARHANTSPRNIQYVFKEFTGLSPLAFLTRYRLFGFYAALKSQKTIEQAANASGLMHHGRASAAFKHYFGACPSEVKRKCKPVGA